MSWNPLWEEIYRARAWGRYPGEDVVRFVLGQYGGAADRAQVRLLEVGCGSGANLWFMAREGFAAHGLEGSGTAVRLCQERLDRECPGWRSRGDVRQGDFARLPYPDGHFDAVIDVVAICYASVEEAQGVYAELARVTKPGGRLFSRTFARGCWGEGTGTATGTDMWTCTEGPLAGHGPTRFTAAADVPALLRGWRVERVEHACLSEGNGAHDIRYLHMYGLKE